MSSIPIVNQRSSNNRQRRRQSSTPRPASTVPRSPEKPCSSASTDNSHLAALQNSSPTVLPRTYSRTKWPLIPSEKPTPPSSYDFSRDTLPRSDSLLPYHQRPSKNYLSGISQQLHIKHHSRQSLARTDAAICSNKNGLSTSLLLPAQHRLPKSKTSTHLAKSSLNLTPQRQLMKPIDPPLPRSQTTASLPYFAGDGTKVPVKSGSGPVMVCSRDELSVLDALQESRMTDREIEISKKITKETHLNNERMQQMASKGSRNSAADTREFADLFSMTRTITPFQADPFPTGILSRLGKINVMKNEEMDRKLLRKNGNQRRNGRGLPVDGTTDGNPRVDANLTNIVQQQPSSRATLDEEADKITQRAPHDIVSASGRKLCTQAATPRIIYGSVLDEEWEVDIKLVRENVYFGAENSYWAGRFSTLCDRLKTADAHLVSSNYDSALASTFHQESPNADESFDVAERRRMEYALKELRSYCRTSTALGSFEEFEFELRENLNKRVEAQIKVAQGSFVRSAEQVITAFKPKADSRPKLGWNFGPSQMSHLAAKSIATGSIIASKQKAVMVKSKTTSNLASMLDGLKEIVSTPNANASSASDAKSLPGLSWQRPTVHEAQAQAKRIREQRVLAKVMTYRRASGQDSGICKRWSGAIDADTNSEESVGAGVAQGWRVNELPSAEAKLVTKGGVARKSSGADSLSLKKVLSESVKGMRKVRRSITGSGSLSGNERITD